MAEELDEILDQEEELLDIDELIAGDEPKTIIETLKTGRGRELPNVEQFRKEYDPLQHKIFDPLLRKDKKKFKADGITEDGTIPINRLGFPLQKRIVNSIVSFTFGNPVKLNSEVENDESQEAKVLKALKRVDYDNKMPSFNRRIARDLSRSTEIAEYWYAAPTSDGKKHSTYGFDTDLKIRVMSFSPWNNNLLYPFFDDTADMIAFSRQFTKKNVKGEDITYFETYTPKKVVAWREESGGWVKVKDKTHPFGKIPVVYGVQDDVEWRDIQPSADRLETLLSNFAETIDYHSSPKIYFEGKVVSVMQKGDAGGMIEGSKGSKGYYLSWNHAPDAVKLEIETLLRFIYSFTQTPDISFDSVKGLHQISGEALKMLFMDAHLKVMEKREIWDEYLQRRINLQKTIIGTLNQSLKAACDSLEVTPEIIPFIVNDDTSLINNLLAANGNKPIISQKKSVELLGWVDDTDQELDQIAAEKEEEALKDIFEPTV